MNFALDIHKFAKKTNMSLEKSSRGIIIKLFSSVIMDTRVDTGRLRANWQTNAGSRKTGELERTEMGKAIAEVNRKVNPMKDMYLTNNLPYAIVYEEKDGMIARNVARFKRIVSEAVRDVS